MTEIEIKKQIEEKRAQIKILEDEIKKLEASLKKKKRTFLDECAG